MKWLMGENTMLVVVSLFFLLLCLKNYSAGGWVDVIAGLKEGVGMLKGFAIIILSISLVGGQLIAMNKRHPEHLEAMLSGPRAIEKAFVIGSSMPTTISACPILRSGWENGSMSKQAIIMFLIASMLTNWQIQFMLRGKLLGFELTVISFAVGLVICGFSFVALEMWSHYSTPPQAKSAIVAVAKAGNH